MEIIVKAPENFDCKMQQWPAQYECWGTEDAQFFRIESRSAIDVVVAKIVENGFLGVQTNYYIASPNFGVAIPGISSLMEDFWIAEQLVKHGMSAPDAVTVSAVLCHKGDF